MLVRLTTSKHSNLFGLFVSDEDFFSITDTSSQCQKTFFFITDKEAQRAKAFPASGPYYKHVTSIIYDRSDIRPVL
jgi:hypothetical protein